MRRITLPESSVRAGIDGGLGIAVEFPVVVDWPELRLTDDQMLANSLALLDGIEEPYPDHRFFSVSIERDVHVRPTVEQRYRYEPIEPLPEGYVTILNDFNDRGFFSLIGPADHQPGDPRIRWIELRQITQERTVTEWRDRRG